MRRNRRATGIGGAFRHISRNVYRCGIAAVVLLACVGCPSFSPQPSTGEESAAQSPFDGLRAYDDLETIVGIGPRPPASPESARLREYIRQELGAAGLEVREHPFTATTPIGTREMVNMVGVVQGTREGVIIVGGHYDTKYFPNIRFVGANDGGSSTALLIETGRVLGARRDGRSVWLCFFDGEEAFQSWSREDSLYGSRALVRELERTGELVSVRAMINVDMVGDCALGIHQDAGSPQWMIDVAWGVAGSLGYSAHFADTLNWIEDDHLPFRERGIPALDLIDFDYGPQNSYWHTAEDSVDHVCSGSLQVVGDVIYHALPRIDNELDSEP